MTYKREKTKLQAQMDFFNLPQKYIKCSSLVSMTHFMNYFFLDQNKIKSLFILKILFLFQNKIKSLFILFHCYRYNFLK